MLEFLFWIAILKQCEVPLLDNIYILRRDRNKLLSDIIAFNKLSSKK